MTATELVVRDAAGRHHVVPTDRPATIGRAGTCDIRVEAREVSGRHACIRRLGGEWVLEDLGSLNGTFLDGRPVVPRAVLVDGAVIDLAGPGEGPRLVCAIRQTPGSAPLPPPPPVAVAPPASPVAPVVPRIGEPIVQTVHRAGGPSGRPGPGAPVVGSFGIGRADDCRHRVDDDLLVSRHHATVEVRADGTASVRDLGSANSTFVDGIRADDTLAVAAGQRITVGNTVFRFDGTELHRIELAGDVVFAADRLVVGTDGQRRLDEVSFWLSERSFLAVLGTSGSGKSTLLKAITGMEPATSGTVLYDGLDLYERYGELRARIGYVPQDDVLHPQLTVAQTLLFGAELRFSPDVTAAERETRVREVLHELGLADRYDLPVAKLSGGQRKRLSVGLELLTRPSLLILDEPTSGLDPGNERSLMRLLRDLADGGRTIIVVTHSTESLHLCDRVLFLARGGILTYFGPPMALPDHFACRDYADAFHLIDVACEPRDLRQKYRSSVHARELDAVLPQERADPAGAGRTVAVRRPNVLGQTPLFVRRYLRVLLGERRSLLMLGLQAPVIALLMLVVFGSGNLRPPSIAGIAPEAGNVLMALVLAAVYTGASNAVREIVKERAVLRREQNFGISAAAYLASKVIVLGAITVVQAAVLVMIGTARQEGPTKALVLTVAKLELIASVSLCGLSAMALGLLISAAVSTPDKAMTVLPIVLFAQFLLAGLVFPVDKPGLQQVSWVTSSHWGLSAVASTSEFSALRGCERPASRSETARPGGDAPDCPWSWDHSPGVWVVDNLMLVVLTVTYLAIAWLVIVRRDPAAVLLRQQQVRAARAA